VITMPKDITISDRMAEELSYSVQNNGNLDPSCPESVLKALRSRGLVTGIRDLTDDGRDIARRVASGTAQRKFTVLRPNGGH
jgi:hypothetical protein